MAVLKYAQIFTLLALVVSVQSHLAISYPGQRGGNLVTNGTVAETNGLSIAFPNGTTGGPVFPYGSKHILITGFTTFWYLYKLSGYLFHDFCVSTQASISNPRS